MPTSIGFKINTVNAIAATIATAMRIGDNPTIKRNTGGNTVFVKSDTLVLISCIDCVAVIC